MTLSAVTERHSNATPFRHEALLYAGDEEFLAGALAFIGAGLEQGEPVLVTVPPAKIAALRERLGSDAADVEFADIVRLGANPARIIPAWRRFVDACSARGGPFRGIAEPIWPGRRHDELVECQRHEELLNLAFHNVANFRLLCPYDTAALGDEVVREAVRAHGAVREGPDAPLREASVELDLVAQPFDRPLPPPVAVLDEIAIEAAALAQIRRVVAARARECGMNRHRADDLVIAVNEITSNTVRHGGGRGTLRIWWQPPAVVCEVADRGRITDPLAGRIEPPEGGEGGRGIWMATQLCDLIQLRAFESGSVVRLHMRVD